MLDFVRKSFLWDALDRGLQDEIGENKRFHLKTVQDLAVYDQLRQFKGKSIAEIGGGKSRLLARLALNNACCNVEKFEGADGGPKVEFKIQKVRNVFAFLGERTGLLQKDSFDAVFSVSVIEHIPDNRLSDFLAEGIDILRQGGLWLHAIDLYLENEPTAEAERRLNAYRKWVDHPAFEPIGAVYDGPAAFSCDMATNPDDVMYDWGKIAPALIEKRKRAQSVTLIMGLRKR